ncbi:MAG TPA: hypothetical protein VGN52_09280 [Burkholderiales bacterium]
MPKGDALYAMMFPDIAPLFKPEGLLEWLAWYQARRQNRQLIRDGRRWHGEVPGFPGAAAMAVTAQGKEDNAPDLVVLQDAGGQTLVEMLVEYKDDGRTLLTNNAGVFTLDPADERKVRFKDPKQDRSFEWRGPGLWNLRNQGSMDEMMARNDQLQMGNQGNTGNAAMVAGVAAGAVAAITAEHIMQERERAREERRAQRRSTMDTDY